ncbi:MAG: spiro-SPASM protein [Treponema sp.]|nr:spiro-SPASM protein [Treponema sp.]
MKFIVILFSDENDFQKQKLFPSASGSQKSAFERSMEWAEALNVEGFQKEVKLLNGKGWTAGELLENLLQAAKAADADFIVYASSSCAFLDLPLSKKLIQDHVEYKAEYTFADGYPAGFAPEIIDCGAAAIMAQLCKGVSAEQAKKPVSKECLFDVIKGDVNSFEIESEISSEDYRLLRLDFICDSKLKALSSEAAAKKLAGLGKQGLLELDKEKIGEENVLAICEAAKNEPGVLAPLPAFYNIQIEGRLFSKNSFSPCEQKDQRMPYESFSALTKKIKDFSDDAVVSLSLFGEAALHPDFDKFLLLPLQEGLSVFVEIDGGLLPDFLQGNAYKNIKASLQEEAARKKIYFAVCLDAFSQETFSLFHSGDLQKAAAAIKELASVFPETYAQFVRVQKNESELEAFYRFWSEKNSPSNGKIIIQKYDFFCGLLPDVKSADLSPLVREPCWHLRRDMDIALDGSVLLCRDRFSEEKLGNAFESDLGDLWKKKEPLLTEHIQKKYCGLCGKCDEYYTFNF